MADNIPFMLFDKRNIESINKSISIIDDKELKEKLLNIEKKISLNILKEDNKNKKYIDERTELNVYNKLCKAFKNNQKVIIKYYNLQHGESIRIIYSLGMYLFQGEWWCSSYWEEKSDMRQFHIKRILDCDILNETFDPRKINILF